MSVIGTGTVGSGGTLTGAGRVSGPVTISSATAANQGGTIAPGNGIGTIAVDSMIWLPKGRYAFEFNPNSSSTPGTTNDFIDGTLNGGS